METFKPINNSNLFLDQEHPESSEDSQLYSVNQLLTQVFSLWIYHTFLQAK
jgi:hypothetical protein